MQQKKADLDHAATCLSQTILMKKEMTHLAKRINVCINSFNRKKQEAQKNDEILSREDLVMLNNILDTANAQSILVESFIIDLNELPPSKIEAYSLSISQTLGYIFNSTDLMENSLKIA